MAVGGAGDDAEGPANEADRFDTPGFARTYVVTFVARVAGAAAFVGGCGLAFLTRPGGAVLIVAGAVALVVGSVACSIGAYGVLRPLGYTPYTTYSRSRPWASPSLTRYREYQALLRRES